MAEAIIEHIALVVGILGGSLAMLGGVMAKWHRKMAKTEMNAHMIQELKEDMEREHLESKRERIDAKKDHGEIRSALQKTREEQAAMKEKIEMIYDLLKKV